MKLSDYAKQQGVHYETAWRWFQDGKIRGHRVGAHTIMIDEGQETDRPQKVAIYARVSSAEKKSHLYGQRRAKRKTEKMVQELETEHAVS